MNLHQSNAIMDRVLELEARLKESEARVTAWEETAARYARNEDYYRWLVIKCGECFGVQARTQDDGGIVKDVLCAKVPELVIESHAKLQAYEQAMEREKKPDWVKWHKDLAQELEILSHYLDDDTSSVEHLQTAARELRYMADSFTLKANFVPAELRIKELEAALKFYSDETNWMDQNWPHGDYTSHAYIDKGAIATQALKSKGA